MKNNQVYLISSWIIGCLLCATNLKAQDVSSPYSFIGIGEVYNTNSIQAIGRGGASMGVVTPYQQNFQNASMLSYNGNTILDIGGYGSWKLNETMYNGTKLKQSGFGGGINHMSIAFPIVRSKKHPLSMAVGLRPYSNVNYEYNSTELLPSSQVFAFYNYKGAGGVNQLYGAWGFRLLNVNKIKTRVTKDSLGNEIKEMRLKQQQLAIGLSSEYNFGRTEVEARSSLDLSGAFAASLLEERVYSKLIFKPSVTWSVRLRDNLDVIPFKKSKNPSIQPQKKATAIFLPNYMTFGASYRASYAMPVSITRSMNQVNSGQDILFSDTLTSVSETITMPSEFNMGISFQYRPLTGQSRHVRASKYTVAVDFKQTKWSEYEGLNGLDSLKDSYRISSGIAYTPFVHRDDDRSFLTRLTYRAGFYYQTQPITYNNQQLEDVGINFGVSIPVQYAKDRDNLKITSQSRINLAATLGRRGYVAEGVVQEKYFKLHFGITMNENWFKRIRIN